MFIILITPFFLLQKLQKFSPVHGEKKSFKPHNKISALIYNKTLAINIFCCLKYFRV